MVLQIYVQMEDSLPLAQINISIVSNIHEGGFWKERVVNRNGGEFNELIALYFSQPKSVLQDERFGPELPA